MRTSPVIPCCMLKPTYLQVCSYSRHWPQHLLVCAMTSVSNNGPPSLSLQKAGTTIKGTKEEAWRFGVGNEKDFIMETELSHLIVHSENLLFFS